MVRGIVLAGTYHWRGSTFEELLPRPLVPVAQTPLICYSLRWLRNGAVPAATICANSASRAIREHLADGGLLSIQLDYLEDWTPRGAAGCVRDAGLRTDAHTFVIADGTAVPSVNLQWLLEAHRATQAAVTVVVHADPHAAGAERPFTPSGLYVFDRRVLELIPAHGFQDIKENLIPRLHQAGERVLTYEGNGSCPRVLNAQTYLAVNHWMIERLCEQPAPLEAWGTYVESGDLLSHPTARVDKDVTFVGPVLLGPSVRVLAGATIVGPTTIGADSLIAEGALVSRSVAWNRCVIGPGAVVDGCVLADDSIVEPQVSLRATVKTPSRDLVGSVAEWRARRRLLRPELSPSLAFSQRPGSA